ncbi:DSD1 family PLP-dependent enzyme [Planctomicrobium sp.]|jgi:D-serine deaminase-like pyridoxal phosphate-dependent protein|nr:DSD1 family PLP-dependent enzyme [Planctomicrobium sp.]MDA7504108.1 DSD1 family PLP-dependent enzyme [bacterium]MDB4743740.1 DSD1 family PLP-dependent enzyme [Planctomicrobium sp.]MDB4802412.1 DSD1 family PLP-dependent enzyme [bacterium]
MIGKHFSELDTPALCIELSTMEANMHSMMSFMQAHGKNWRPHVKCHKLPVIAQQQVDCGAIGVTSAKSSEAAVFAENGIDDILIANMIIGDQKLQRVARLCQIANPIVACDHFVQAEALSDVCRQHGVRCRVIIEVDLGMNRVGVRPGPDARTLAEGINRLPGIELAGIMGYEGHLLMEPDQEKKRKLIFSAMAVLEELKTFMVEKGMMCDIVSVGGTGSYHISATHPVVTELQAGAGVFADPFYMDRCGLTELKPALTLLATVVSRPNLERAVLDIGRKAVHPDIHPPHVLGLANGKPLDDAQVDKLSAEHMTLKLSGESLNLTIGDKVVLRPGYSDHTTVLHNEFYGLRNGIVESVWEIAARGKLQ